MNFQFGPANCKEMAAKNIRNDYGITKAKSVPVLNYAACDEVVWRNGGTAPCTPQHWTEMRVELHVPTELSNNHFIFGIWTGILSEVQIPKHSHKSRNHNLVCVLDLTIYLQPPALTGHEIISILMRFILSLMRASRKEKVWTEHFRKTLTLTFLVRAGPS